MTASQQLLLGEGAGGGAAAAYQISRSLRFNSADSTYLNRTPGSAGNRRTWTWSAWVKRSGLTGGTEKLLFQSGYNTVPWFNFQFETNEALGVSFSAGSTAGSVTAAVFRDLSAWYHIVLAVDTTQATAANRVKLYVNNVQQTFASTNYPSQNYDTPVNNTVAHTMGGYASLAGYYFPGYMTEIYLIDGQQLTPSSFGETNTSTGVWQPKQVTGMTYGTNGFYINFSDNSNNTAATLGKDYSGNGNNWTPNNFSVTAGAGNDSLVDTPTPYGTDTGAGGEVRGNYCTSNPLLQTNMTISNGALSVVGASNSNWGGCTSTLGMSSGKWYWEITVDGGSYHFAGIGNINFTATTHPGGDAAGNSWGYYSNDGNKVYAGSPSAYGASWTTAGTVIGVAFDADAGTLVFYKNNTSQGTAFSSLTSGPYVPAVGLYQTSSAVTVNFGQRAFAYTAPTGYKALCTQNLPTPAVGATSTTQANDYFTPYLYTGDGSNTRSLTGVGFQPDFTWSKARTSAYQHQLFDAVRGTGSTKNLQCASTAVEGTDASLYGYLTSFDTDGFSVSKGTDVSVPYAWVNQNSTNYVVWNWKANGSGSSNTDGSLTSTVSASTTSGFSIATFTTPGSGTSTVGHGLGVAPSMIIFKARNGAFDWVVYHKSIGNTGYVLLNSTNAAATDSTFFNNTSPTSTVFTLGTAYANSKNYVAYCFASINGFSAFGSYSGNGSTDGPFVYTGFRPAFIMVKNTTDAGVNWLMWDNKMNTYNVVTTYLLPNATNSEYTDLTLDMVSNGFKPRVAGGTGINQSGKNYIYAAFAENPFKYSLAR